MINRACITLLLLFVFTSCEKDEKETFDLIITNGSIVDVRSGSVAEDQRILINNGTIVRIEKNGDEEKYSAKEFLNAEGKFLMPGLWDMHVHFRGGDTLIAENQNMLPLFLAFGITTVRDAGGDITPAVLEWREKINRGEMVGPNIYTPGPKLDGDNPTWPGSIEVTNREETEDALDSLEVLGADFVKMYDGNLTKENFYDIIRVAEARGLKTTGHMPLTADFLEAIDLGLDGAEHMYYPLTACSPKIDSLRTLGIGYGMMETIIDSYDPDLAQKVFAKMSENKVYVTPTLHIGRTLADILEVDHSKDTLLPYIGSGVQKTYQGRIEGAKRAKASGSKMREKMEEISAAMIKPMTDAGVKILAGSDCGAFNSFVYPGESLHGELQSLVDAGLTPEQALSTSVINGPVFFDAEDKYGSVSEGKVADLILLKNNPLEDIAHLREIIAVVRQGKIFDRAKLDVMMDEVKQRNNKIEQPRN